VRAFEASSLIGADPNTIWAILTDASSYTAWDSGFERVDGKIAPGATITVVSKVNPGRAFPVKVTELSPGQKMVWSGGMPLGLFKGVRTFTLAPHDGGATRFHMREEYTGPLLPVIWRPLPDLRPSFAQFARGLLTKRGPIDQLLWEQSLATAVGTQLVLELSQPALAEDGYLFLPGCLDREVVMAAREEIFSKWAAVGAIDMGHLLLEGIAATLARLLAREGAHVTAIDGDPNPNLSVALGLSEEQRARLQRVPANVLEESEDDAGNYHVELVKPMDEIEHEYAVSEDRAVLAPGFRVLDARERTILQLRFFEGLTQSQIAQQVGISQMHVSRLIRRSLEKIRETIAEDEESLAR